MKPIMLSTERLQPSATCLMLDKYGNRYKCIDNLFHPNPGTEADEYSEIERTVDWLIDNNIYPIFEQIEKWLRSRLSNLYLEGETSLDSAILDTMYCDTYKPCKKLLTFIHKIWAQYMIDKSIAYADADIDELKCARCIANYLNEHFLRVRAGGKLDSDGSDSIYFRISSSDTDWRSAIEDFLFDSFGTLDKMPNYIWIGHDAETNPPEITLFEGTGEELIENYDGAIFANNDITFM